MGFARGGSNPPLVNNFFFGYWLYYDERTQQSFSIITKVWRSGRAVGRLNPGGSRYFENHHSVMARR